MLNLALGERIVELRRMRKMEVSELAKESGLTSSEIIQFESGEREPNVQELREIAQAFNIKMEYFVDSKNNKNRFLDFDDYGISSVDSDMVTLTTINAINNMGARHKDLLWGMLEEITFLGLLDRLDNPTYLTKYTTKKQRKHVVMGLEDLFGGSLNEEINDYIDGKIEISDIKRINNEKRKTRREKDSAVLDEKKDTAIWKMYNKCVDNLEMAVNNDLTDLRYAKLASESIEEYLKETNESDINCKVFATIKCQIDEACESDDEEAIREILEYVNNYYEALWCSI